MAITTHTHTTNEPVGRMEYIERDTHEHHNNWVLPAVFLLVVLAILFILGSGLIRSVGNIGNNAVSVPRQIDVNVNTPQMPEGANPAQ